MAYTKRTWLGRQGTGLNKFSIGGASPVTIVNQPDSVTQTGDALSAGNLNDLEDRIEDAFDDVDTELDTKADEQDITNLNNALTALDHRLENLEQAHGSYVVQNYKDGAITPSGKGAWSIVEGLRGVSRVENQLVDPTNLRTREAYGVTITANADGSITVSGTAEASTNLDFTLNNFGTVGHSYVVCGGKSSGNIVINDGTHIVTDSGAGAVLLNSTGTVKLQFPITNGVTYNVTITPCVTDLNIYFGGTIPSDADTIAKIQRDYPHLLTPSEYGTRIVDSSYSGVRAEGVNLIDASNLVDDSYVESLTGIIRPSLSGVKRTDYMRVKGGESYFFGGYITANQGNTGAYYDINKNFLGAIPNDSNARPFVAPANCAYVVMNFWLNKWGDLATTAYFVPYDLPHEWSPYMENTLSLTFSGKSAGSVYDSCEPNVEVGGVAKKRETSRIGVMTFNGTESWLKSGSSGAFYVTMNSTTFPYKFASDVQALSRYVFLGTGAQSADVLANADKAFGLYYLASSTVREIWFKDTSFATTDAWKTHLAQNPLTLYYELAEEVVTLSDPILDNTLLTEAYGRMSTVQTGTVVDGSFDMGFITL